MNGDDEDSFDAEMESEALLEEQRATPPLSSKSEPQQAATETDKPGDKQASEPDPELPEALKGKYVPHGRFHETNERLKETNQRYGLLEQRTNKLLEIIQQQLPQKQEQAPKDEIPGAEDFVGRLDYLVNKVGGIEKQTKEQQQRQQQEQQGVELGRRVLSATQQDFAAAQAEDPTLDDAYNHLTNSRTRELMAVYGLTKDEAEAHYKQEELDLYHGALRRQERPSAVVKRLAEARGWVPKPPTNDNTEQDREQRKLQHRSLSQMGGREGPSALNAKDLAKMSEDEYAKLSDDVIKAIMRKAS
jgi:hypothetical protein